MAGTYISILILTATTAVAATTYSVYNVPDMFLYTGINTTQTTGIKMTGPIRNGTTVSYPALTGGVLELRQGSKVEHIYYSSASVNSTTKVVTLSGTVIRDLCWSNATTYVGCSNGQSFSRGASVRLVDDHRLFNLSAKLDTVGVTTGSGAYRCGSTTQPCLFPGGVTTAQKNAYTYGTASGLYPITFDTTLGTMQYWNGSAWINFGSGSIVNATQSVAGKVEIASISEIANLTQTGSTNALLVLSPLHLLKNGTGAVSANRIPLTNGFGAVPVTLGGIGRISVATGAVMIGQGSLGITSVSPGSANTVLKSDGTRLSFASVPAETAVYHASAARANGGTVSTYYSNNASVITMTGSTFTMTGSTTWAAVGDRVHVQAYGSTRSKASSAGTWTVAIKCGSTTLAQGSFTMTDNQDYQPWRMDVDIIAAVVGASGKMHAIGTIYYAGTTTTWNNFSSHDKRDQVGEISLDTTANCQMKITSQFGTADTANGADLSGTFYQKLSVNPF